MRFQLSAPSGKTSGKIALIKVLRSVTGWGLKEAKDVSDRVEIEDVQIEVPDVLVDGGRIDTNFNKIDVAYFVMEVSKTGYQAIVLQQPLKTKLRECLEIAVTEQNWEVVGALSNIIQTIR